MTKITVNMEFDTAEEFSRFFLPPTLHPSANNEPRVGALSTPVVDLVSKNENGNPQGIPIVTSGEESSPDVVSPAPRRRASRSVAAPLPIVVTPVVAAEPAKVEPVKEPVVIAPTRSPDEIKQEAYNTLRDLSAARNMPYAMAFLAEFFEVKKFGEIDSSKYPHFIELAKKDIENGPLLPEVVTA